VGKAFDGTVTEVSLQALTEVAGEELSRERAPHGSDAHGDTDDDDLAESHKTAAGHDE
jgi:hypothetical protein